MKAHLLAAIAMAMFAVPGAASAADTFSNDFSFTSLQSNTVVKGTLSGLMNGDNLSATGLSITIAQSPITISNSFSSPTSGTYSASNGIITSNTYFSFSGKSGGYFYFTAPYKGLVFAELASTSGSRTANANSAGVTFVGAPGLLTAAVPEPAAWAMMIVGVGAIGFAMRRQKTTTRVAYAA